MQAALENRAAVRDTINNINVITNQARPELQQILTNVRQVTEDVRKMTAAAEAPGQGGKPGEIRSAVERINRASSSLESALQHADNVAARIDEKSPSVRPPAASTSPAISSRYDGGSPSRPGGGSDRAT